MLIRVDQIVLSGLSVSARIFDGLSRSRADCPSAPEAGLPSASGRPDNSRSSTGSETGRAGAPQGSETGWTSAPQVSGSARTSARSATLHIRSGSGAPSDLLRSGPAGFSALLRSSPAGFSTCFAARVVLPSYGSWKSSFLRAGQSARDLANPSKIQAPLGQSAQNSIIHFEILKFPR